jgi:tetratricopeptide (TPR) repeat protein
MAAVSVLGSHILPLRVFTTYRTTSCAPKSALEWRSDITQRRTGKIVTSALDMPLGCMGILEAENGRARQGILDLEAARTLFEHNSHRYGHAETLSAIGKVYHRYGQLEEALVVFGQAMELYEKLGNRTGQCNCYRAMGSVLLAAGRQSEAYHPLMESLRLSQLMDYRLGLVNTLYDLGHYHLAMNETDRAWRVCHEALSLLDCVEYAGGLINILALQSEIFRRKGQYTNAIKSADRAHRVGRRSGSWWGVCLALLQKVYALKDLGRMEPARATARALETLANRVGNTYVAEQSRTFLVEAGD